MQPIIQTTGWKLPQTVIANGAVTGNQWSNPNNLLLVDGDLAESVPAAGVASDVTLGNYNFNIPQGAVIVGIEMQLIGKGGAQTNPPLTISPNLLDDTSGSDVYYPYVTPFTGMTPSVATYILGTPTYTFASSFSVDQINNAKLNLVANGDLYIDSCLMQVFYYIPSTPTPPAPITDTCADCDSVIELPYMTLWEPFLSGQSSFVLTPGSFTYANGQPVQPGDVGSCGGQIPFTFDEGLRQANGGNFQEDAVVDTNNGGSWIVQQDGSIKITLASINDRGLLPYTPYTHNASFMSNHDANSKVIISNSGRWTFSLLKKCQIGVLVSAPIEVDQNGTLVAKPVTKFNFSGAGQSTTVDGLDPEQVNIVIPGVGGTTPPVVTATVSGTSGSVQVTTLTLTLPVSGINRNALVQIATENLASVVSVVGNGSLSFSRLVQDTDAGHNLRSEQWNLVAPPVGNLVIVITLSQAAYISAGAENIVGVDQATPIGATNSANGTSTSPSVTVTTDRDYSQIFDGLVTAITPILLTPGAGSALNWSEETNSDMRQGSSSVQPAGTEPDSVMMQYSITQNTPWVITGVEVHGITSIVPPSAGVASVTGLDTDNTDPANPVIEISVDGTTITGLGTPGSPLVAHTGITPGNSAGPFGIYSFQTSSISGSNPLLAQVIYDPGSQSIYTLGQIGSGGTNQSLIISRLQQDMTSGIWNVTATATPTSGTATFANNGIFVSGSTLYIIYNDNYITGQIQLGTYALNLTGFSHSSITLSGSGSLANNSMWSDGTDIWVFRDTHLYQHNITGNTNTTYTLSGFTAANIQTFIINGTTLYGMKDVSGVKTVMTASISGSVVTQTASYVLTAFDATPNLIGQISIQLNIPCIYSSGASLNSIISYPVAAAYQSPGGGNPSYTSGTQYAKFASLTIAT